jgi:hypothetical protein
MLLSFGLFLELSLDFLGVFRVFPLWYKSPLYRIIELFYISPFFLPPLPVLSSLQSHQQASSF